MEAFSLLKYWRTTAGGGPKAGNTSATTIVATAAAAASSSASDGEEGHVFNLEFALTDDDSDNEEEEEAPQESVGQDTDEETQKTDENESGSDSEELSENEEHLKFFVAGHHCTNQNDSPSNELLFKGNLVPLEEENTKFSAFLLKSATKFRLPLPELKKSKSGNGFLEKTEKGGINNPGNPDISKVQEKQGRTRGKFFTVKFRVKEGKAPLVSMLSRDFSSKENHGKVLKNDREDSESIAVSYDRKLTKEMVKKYLKKVKPLYIRVSKRYVQKLKAAGHLSFHGGGSKGGGAPQAPAKRGGDGPAPAPSSLKTPLKPGNISTNLQAGLKVVRKHLSKSRSASANAAAAPGKVVTSDRRDDSMLQVQDGIQGAILHCKKSFNASKDEESSTILNRSLSNPLSHERTLTMPMVSLDSTRSYSEKVKAEAKV